MTLRVCLPTNNPQLEELSLSLTYHPSDGGGLLSFWIGRQGLSIKHMYCTLNVLQPCLFSQLFNVRVEKGNSAWGRFRKYWNQQPTIGWSVGFLYSHQLFVVDEEKMYFSVPTQIISKGEQPGTALFFSGLSLSLSPTAPPWPYTSQGPYGVWPLRCWKMVPCGQVKLAGRKAGEEIATESPRGDICFPKQLALGFSMLS